MKIGGLQKLSLLDYPGKTCCTVFTQGCNYHCPFCHNASLVGGGVGPGVEEAAVLAFLEKRRGLLDGVCVSGGEPLLQPGLAGFLRRVKELGFAVKLDTNGSFPERLEALVADSAVDMVSMDIKTAPPSYGRVAGVEHFDPSAVLQSAACLMDGAVEYEFRTTVVRGLHTEQDFEAIAEWLRGAKHYYLQAFVDSGEVLQPGFDAFSKGEMEHFLSIVRREIPAAELRGM